MARRRFIIGLVGDAGAGKDTVAGFLVERGFVHRSASDIVREEIRALGLPTSRATQTRVANDIRRTRGHEYFIRAAFDRATRATSRDLVLSGIYSPSEAQFLERDLGGSLVAVRGSAASVNYQRVQARSDGDRDLLSHETFDEAVRRESSGNHVGEANVNRCIQLASHTIMNDGTLQDLATGVDAMLEQLRALAQ